jgi:hypothetical protein
MWTRAIIGIITWMVCGSPLAAQALKSAGPTPPMPRAEIAFGLDQWVATPESAAEPAHTRYGAMMFSRGRLLGHANLSETPGELVVGDFLDVGVGFYAGTGREPGVMRIPVNYGLAVARRLAGGTELVARAGMSFGLGYDATGGPFVGGRLKSGPVGVEGLFITANEATLSQWFLRWYPRSRTVGFNVALRYELEQSTAGSLLVPERGVRDQSVMLVFSVER